MECHHNGIRSIAVTLLLFQVVIVKQEFVVLGLILFFSLYILGSLRADGHKPEMLFRLEE